MSPDHRPLPPGARPARPPVTHVPPMPDRDHADGDCDCDCKPRCPACGGLECVCRPRFFAGQLLTDEVMNGLARYVVDRNKLHNRYLFGSGVVCGLEVRCDPCGSGGVTVSAGYALGPCGEDIVVCAEAHVSVCDLISACLDREPDDCRPYGGREHADCAELEEEWILTVRYDEKPQRPLTPLINAAPSCSVCSGTAGSRPCGCGGTGGADCSCGGHSHNARPKANGRALVRHARTPAPAECEPTLICEGFVFEVSRKPARDRKPRRGGPMAERFGACVEAMRAATPPEPPDDASRSEKATWCCDMRARLVQFFIDHPSHDCSLARRADAVSCPDPKAKMSNAEFERRYDASRREYRELVAEYTRACMCSALLPPCPGEEHDSRIPLATVTVRRSPCEVLRVCNWDVRDFAYTFTNLSYWLSAMPFEAAIRERVSEMCCEKHARRQPRLRDREPRRTETHVGELRVDEHAAPPPPEHAAEPLRGGFEAVVAGMAARDPSGDDALALARPFEMVMAREFVAPLARDVGLSGAGFGASSELEEMREELATLRHTIDEQRARIDRLSDRREG